MAGPVENAVDAAVVGAGITGLAVADGLVRAGRSVVVLEARDRVGGRLLSAAVGDAGSPIDLGATWFWPNEQRVIAMVSRLALDVHSQHIAGDAVYQDTTGTQRLSGNPIDVTSGRFVGGAQGLADALAATLPADTLRLNSPVGTVEARHDRLVVRSAARGRPTIGADHVVIAAPPALAVSKIEFLPPLPDRLAALAAATPVWMGAVTKVVAVYATPFWRDRGLSGSAISHIGPMRELHDMSGDNGVPAAIFGFVPGTGVGGKTVTKVEVRQQLAELFGQAAADPIAIHIKDWRNEEWTSPPDVERLTAYQTYGHGLYQEPIAGGHLHFASTETATESPGHIEGALASAERTVAAILATEPDVAIDQPHREHQP